jgi:hypothetical protein
MDRIPPVFPRKGQHCKSGSTTDEDLTDWSMDGIKILSLKVKIMSYGIKIWSRQEYRIMLLSQLLKGCFLLKVEKWKFFVLIFCWKKLLPRSQL